MDGSRPGRRNLVDMVRHDGWVVGWLVAVQPQGSAWLGGGVVLCYLGLFVCVLRAPRSSERKADEEER